LVLGGGRKLKSVGDDFVFTDSHIQFDNLCNLQVLQGLGRIFHSSFGSILSGSLTSANNPDNFLNALAYNLIPPSAQFSENVHSENHFLRVQTPMPKNGKDP